jgi:hypothetical protein
MGQEADKEILATTNLVADPLIDAWVGGIAQTLFTETARKDVPYSIKVLDVPDVNAFSTLGGFIYLDEGTLDFVQSDDELAGVIGHETGHIERRHVLQNENKVGFLNVLFTLGAMFSPFVYRFGQMMEAGAVAKIERDDEYQADKYGLMLMTRSGYDPAAMVSFMQHLGAYAGDRGSLIDKYLADHPDTPKRVAALVGYPELDPTVRTNAQRLAAAIHDQDEARYAIAARSFGALVAADPSNTIARYHLGETQLALGNDPDGIQNLTQAAAAGSPEMKALAATEIAAVRDGAALAPPPPADLAPLRDALAAARRTHDQAVVAVLTRRDSGHAQLDALQAREEAIAYEMPDLSQIGARTGSRLDAVLTNIATMSRAITAAQNKAQATIEGAGSPVSGRAGGALARNAALLDAMAAPLQSTAPTPYQRAAIAQYPRMLAGIAASDADLVRAVDAARASLAVLDLALGSLDHFIRSLESAHLSHGDIVESDYTGLVAPMNAAVDALNGAAGDASQAAQLFDMARAERLQARIDLLGTGATPARYAAFRHALDVRFHNASIDYPALVAGGISPGEAAAASIVAADTNSTPQAVIADARAGHRSMVAEANARGMQTFALKVFLSLVLFDYTDDPLEEARVET